MTTLAMRKRQAASVGGKAAQPSRAGALAIGMLLLIVCVAALRAAPDLRAWWGAAPGSDADALA
ncbi:hypothetical protein DF161_13840, partial [Burkholderia stagnalis]